MPTVARGLKKVLSTDYPSDCHGHGRPRITDTGGEAAIAASPHGKFTSVGMTTVTVCPQLRRRWRDFPDFPRQWGLRRRGQHQRRLELSNNPPSACQKLSFEPSTTSLRSMSWLHERDASFYNNVPVSQIIYVCRFKYSKPGFFCPLFRIPQSSQTPVFWVRPFSDWVRQFFRLS